MHKDCSYTKKMKNDGAEVPGTHQHWRFMVSFLFAFIQLSSFHFWPDLLPNEVQGGFYFEKLQLYLVSLR